MPTWPSTFCPLMGSFQETPPDNVIRSSMDRGPQQVRRRTTANVRLISFSLYLTPEEMQELDDFFNVDTIGGSITFDYIHPRTLVACQARFASPPQYSDRSRGYQASVSLEIMP